MLRRIFAFGGLVLVALTEHDAGACSCRAPQAALITPDRVSDAPLNTIVRVERPLGEQSRVILRARRSGRTWEDIRTRSRTTAPGGELAMLELTPFAPLDPSTQYEVAIPEPPGTVVTETVVGTFRTGTATDTTPPRLDALGVTTVVRNPHANGASCQVEGPWVVIEGVHAEDPGRPTAQLAFGVWLGDAAGNIDAQKPPAAILSVEEEKLHIGQYTLCDPHGFTMPKAPTAWFGIAALDEAGNASAVRRFRVALGGGARAP
jgi:hypothetical protein